MRIALVGNQNSGKTTLFNVLTGSNQKVGNWPGVTIERKEGTIKNTDITVVDLPGIYSLSPYSSEEKISRNYLLEDKPDLIINIIDSTSIERSLYLTTQLLEMNIDVILALNMADLVAKRNIKINKGALEEMLGVTVIEISAKSGKGVDHLFEHIVKKDYKKHTDINFFPEDVAAVISSIKEDLKDSFSPTFTAVKAIEGEEEYQRLTENRKEELKTLSEKYEMDGEEMIVSLRYDYIEKIRDRVLIRLNSNPEEVRETWTDKLDKVFLNRYFAIPIFILIMAVVYILSVGLVGGLTVSFVDALFNGAEELEFNFFGLTWTSNFNIAGLGPALGSWLEGLNASPWAVSLVTDGIVAGVGAVCNFLPQLMILFICLSLLETTGYMSRISFFLDRVFHKFGLSGKSIVPFIVGVGCSVPGIMTARTIEDENEKKATILLTPYMPCSAKLPIISCFAGFFFPKFAWLISLTFYVAAVAIILLFGIILKKFIYKREHTTFVSELPEYKVPSFRYVFRDVFDRSFSFIMRAGTVILLCSVILWFLGSFTWNFRYIDGEILTIHDSLLANIGSVFAWFFYPMLGGNLSWGAAVSALSGLVAKEEVIGSMTTIAALGGEGGLFDTGAVFGFFNPITAVAFMTFNLFSAPCFGALGAMRQELGSTKAMLKGMATMSGFAWLISSLIGSISWIITACGGTL